MIPEPNVIAASGDGRDLPERTWVSGEALEPGDAYQEGPYVVFTEQYHLRRGYCCNSACRHCPYR